MFEQEPAHCADGDVCVWTYVEVQLLKQSRKQDSNQNKKPEAEEQKLNEQKQNAGRA